ncbi:DUF3443 family protein [Paraburkholderia silviterrae]|uniref:DUF3443 family protein n=1 Tax=Paraburkholderia silviterrae TaxID=2528715 RepID=A0A4R5MFG1_9BURK|nr:DUF3443 family protein [Paraburkholderia silviterrae]TDG26008.1 DUF3443 family protein [Paraburkholderia silviterrae]
MKIKYHLALAALCSLLAACGGASSDDTSNANLNVVPLTVDKGPLGTSTDVPYVSVTVCAPGTDNCQTIDHVLVDTGSSGLRLLASALTNPAGLLGHTDTTKPVLAQCMTFGSGYTWGTLKSADIRLGGEIARSTPIQLINDPDLSTVPPACQEQGANAGNLKSMNANGILGISTSAHDCGSACADDPTVAQYFSCVGASCTPTLVALENQIPNPITKFSRDNNGSVIVFPSAVDGMASLTGKLIFGIDTRDNNKLGNANIYPMNENMIANVVINGVTGQATLDTGSTGSYFNMAGSPPVCASVPGLTDQYYCASGSTTVLFPSPAGPVAATVNVRDPLQYMATYPHSAVNPSLAGPAGMPNTPDDGTWIMGLPFYFGRTVFTAIDGAQTSKATGPFVAF